MEEKGEAVTIYVKQSDGSYTLDQGALGKVLNQEGVADLPIMIVSVAGATREGKSFLLNLFIKYLESGRNEQWLSDDSKLDGFHWKGGAERDTLGILMWSKPYFVEDEFGKKVAVLLMDTQGAFDNEHDMGQSTKIFTMSLMMCSVQIYNVMQSLRADKLNFFELFLEHAKMVKQETKGNVFQSLMFLVRDWPYQVNHDFGSDGGTMYVKEQLKCFSKNSKIKKKVFKDIFNHYEGFLLPHPGEKVAENRSGVKKFDGEVSDMNEEFAKYIRKLVEHLFRKNNIVKKAITGTEIIGRNLLPYAESIGKLLENESMPEPKDLVEAQIQAHCSSILDEFTRKFHEKMKQFGHDQDPDPFVDDEVVEDEGRKSLIATMEEFEKRQIYGSKDVKNDCRNKLEESLNHAREEAKIRNRDTRNTYRKKYEDFFAKEADLMEKKLGQNFEKRCVLAQEIHEACLESAEEMKRKLTEQNFGAASFNDEFVKKIEHLGVKLRQSLTRKNESELAVAKTKSSATEAELANLAKTMLLEELDENLCSTKLELNKVVEGVKDKVWQRWDEELPDYPDFVIEEFKKSLQGKLQQLLTVAEEQNVANKDKFSRDTSWVLSQVCRKYNEEMEKRLEKKSHDKDILKEFHHESFQKARSTLEQKDIRPKLKKSCMEKIEVELAKELRKVEERNDERTETFKTSCGLQKSNCVEIARERIKEKCDEKVLSEDQIASVQAEAAREARNTFQKQRGLGSKSVYEKHETEMNTELEKLLSVAKKTNKEFEKHFLLTKTTEMKNAKKEYKKAMLEKIDGSEPVKESALDDFHREISANTEAAFMSKMGKLPLDVENECRKRLYDTIKHAFSDIKRENQKKKRDCETKEKQTVAECLEVYNAEMSEATKGRILEDDEMDSNHNAANIKATDKLNSLKAGSSESSAEKMEESLRQCIEERYEYFKQDRDTRKIWAENKVSDRMVRFEQMYRDQMDGLTTGKSWSEEDLRRHHRTALQYVESEIQNIGAGEIRQLCLDEVEKSARTWWMKTENANNTKQNNFETKCEEIKNRAKEAYKREMSRRGIFLTDDSLQEANERARRSAIELFRNARLKGPEDTIDKFEEDLKADLDDKLRNIEVSNNDNRCEMERKASSLVVNGREKYVKKMKEATADTTMTDAWLQDKHSAIVQSIVRDEIASKDLHTSFKEDAEQKFLRRAEEEFGVIADEYSRLRVEQDHLIKDYIKNDCVQSYERKIRELCGEEFQASTVNSHDRQAKQFAITKFRNYDKSWNKNNERQYLELLDTHCLQLRSDLREEGKQNEAEASRDADYLLALAKDEYLNHMNEKCGSVGVEQTVLSNNHGQAKVHARNFINRRQAKKRVKDLALLAFEDATGNLYNDSKNENDARLKQAEATAARKLKEAKEKYEDIMANYIMSVCCHNLQRKHDEIKQDLKRQDANVTDHLLSGPFYYYKGQSSSTQADRNGKYKRTVNDVFARYRLSAYKQWTESKEKWFRGRKLADFEEHHIKIKEKYLAELTGDLPPSDCPRCGNCERNYVKMLADKIDGFKFSQVDRIKDGKGWAF